MDSRLSIASKIVFAAVEPRRIFVAAAWPSVRFATCAPAGLVNAGFESVGSRPSRSAVALRPTMPGGTGAPGDSLIGGCHALLRSGVLVGVATATSSAGSIPRPGFVAWCGPPRLASVDGGAARPLSHRRAAARLVDGG